MTEYLSIAILILILMLCTSGAFLLQWKISQIRTNHRITRNRAQCEPWFDQIVEDVE